MTTTSNPTPADVFQTIAWAALTAVMFGYAIAQGSIGALILGAATLVQTWHAWTSASERPVNDARDGLIPQQQL
jgi:hypothetical protein